MTRLNDRTRAYGRNGARRFFARIARCGGMRVLARRGTTTWVTDHPNVVCVRWGRYTLRTVRPGEDVELAMAQAIPLSEEKLEAVRRTYGFPQAWYDQDSNPF